jgi:hypothetical protein
MAEKATPGAMPPTKFEGHRDGAKVAMDARVRGARFLGGAWLAEDGTPLTDVEAQQAHKAMDAAAADARRKALLGGAE